MHACAHTHARTHVEMYILTIEVVDAAPYFPPYTFFGVTHALHSYDTKRRKFSLEAKAAIGLIQVGTPEEKAGEFLVLQPRLLKCRQRCGIFNWADYLALYSMFLFVSRSCAYMLRMTAIE